MTRQCDGGVCPRFLGWARFSPPHPELFKTLQIKQHLTAFTLPPNPPGTARLGLNDLSNAEKDFRQVLALEPNNRQVRFMG